MIPLTSQLVEIAEEIDRRNKELESYVEELLARLADREAQIDELQKQSRAPWSMNCEQEMKAKVIADQYAEDYPLSLLNPDDDEAMATWVARYAKQVYSGVSEFAAEELPDHVYAIGRLLPLDRMPGLLEGMEKVMRRHPCLDRNSPTFNERASAELTLGIAFVLGTVAPGCGSTGQLVEAAIRGIEEDRAPKVDIERLFGNRKHSERGELPDGSYLKQIIASSQASDASTSEATIESTDRGRSAVGTGSVARRATSRTSEMKRKNETTASNLRNLKDECGWTFEKLAEATNSDSKTVRRQLSGKHSPRPGTLRIYADVFSRELGIHLREVDLQRAYVEGIVRAFAIKTQMPLKRI